MNWPTKTIYLDWNNKFIFDFLDGAWCYKCEPNLWNKQIKCLSFPIWPQIHFIFTKFKKRNLVCLYWSGYYTICTHQRNPTTAWRGHFELLGFPPGPNRTSLDNLATPGSPKVSMLTPSLVRTLVQHVTQCSRTPVLKPSSNSGLPIAWITEPATDPSLSALLKTSLSKLHS